MAQQAKQQATAVKEKEQEVKVGEVVQQQTQVPAVAAAFFAAAPGAVVQRKAVGAMMEEDEGAGFENADKDSYAVPFYSILQSGSPQVKRTEGAYIEKAEEGMIYNSVTREVFDGQEGILVLPLHFRRSFTRWGSRKMGGGLKGEYEPGDPIIGQLRAEGGKNDGFGARYLPDSKGEFHKDTSDVVNDTRTHYLFHVRENGAFSPGVLSVTSTQIKKSKMWMSVMDGIKKARADGTLFTPPMFSHLYRLTTVAESNDQGSWWGWKIELVRELTASDVYVAARGFRDAIKRGEVKVAPMQEEHVGGSSRSSGGEEDLGKDIPF
jgi:hypothetical protein